MTCSHYNFSELIQHLFGKNLDLIKMNWGKMGQKSEACI